MGWIKKVWHLFKPMFNFADVFNDVIEAFEILGD